MRYLGDGEAHGNGLGNFTCVADSIVWHQEKAVSQWTKASAYLNADRTQNRREIIDTVKQAKVHQRSIKPIGYKATISIPLGYILNLTGSTIARVRPI